MKNFRNFFATMIVLFCATAFASCSDKDDDDPAAPAARAIEGTYFGDLACSVMGDVSTFEAVDFRISAIDDNNVKIVLPPFGEAPMALPSITVDGVKVTETVGGSSYSLAETVVTGTTDAGRTYTCTLTGTVTGSTLNLKFNLVYGAMPMPMICSTQAVKK